MDLIVVRNKCTKCKGDIDIIMSLHSKKPYTRCSMCREKYNQKRLCKHEKVKNICVECGGCSLCFHNIPRQKCKLCKPLQKELPPRASPRIY